MNGKMTYTQTAFLDFVKSNNGEALPEKTILEAINISHGSLLAARKALEERGLIKARKVGKLYAYDYIGEGKKKPTASKATKSATAEKKQAGEKQAARIHATATDAPKKKASGKVARLDRFLGDYDTVQDWKVDVLTHSPETVRIEKTGFGLYTVVDDETELAYTVRIFHNDDETIEVELREANY